MGIPLAALGINQQPGPLETVGKALQLKALQQNQQYQAQAQPLELQQQQNQVEMQKRQMADMDAATKAMNDWKSGDLGDLPDLVRKHGGSFNAVMAAHKQVYDQKEQAAKIAEQDATTGSKLVETYQKKADQVSGELSAAKDIPDEQLHDWATGKVTELAQSGLIDTPHAQQMLQALQQTQNPAMIRQGLDHYSKSILGASALAKQAKESQDLKTAQATQKHLEMETAAGVKPTEASLAVAAAGGDPEAEKALKRLDQSKLAAKTPPTPPDPEIKEMRKQLLQAQIEKSQEPTADEQRRADLARNMNENLDQIEEIVNRRPDLFGPVAGRWTQLKNKVGTSDPDIAKLEAVKEYLGMASVGAHAMRNAQHVETAANAILNSFLNSPDAVKAAIGTARSSTGTFMQDEQRRKNRALGGGEAQQQPAAAPATHPFFSKFGGTVRQQP